MQTNASLLGAILFAAIGVASAWLIVPLLEPNENPVTWFIVTGIVGLWAGWVLLGKNAGAGYGVALGMGLSASAGLAFVTLFLFGFIKMFSRAMRGGYDGPLEAVIGIFEYLAEYAMRMAHPPVIALLIIGGLIAAVMTEFIGRRYR